MICPPGQVVGRRSLVWVYCAEKTRIVVAILSRAVGCCLFGCVCLLVVCVGALFRLLFLACYLVAGVCLVGLCWFVVLLVFVFVLVGRLNLVESMHLNSC
ncbi:unnamed protein product [Polarella glacialis]|uniref:Transmembrane protein n=1 Tax=Polarella glacialis TaxID=89957 RepID=A0A813G0N7_POLGL|nr:unnamed protein product [Polarella glacialis]